MRATVVIPSRGGAARLPLLLSTLAAQTYSDWEAIVVIDGDVDASAEVVASFSHLPITSIVFPENRGRVAALNAGFEAATGDVLIRADDDFELNPGHIAAHVEPHLTGEVGVVGLPLNVAPDNAYMRTYGAWADKVGRDGARATPPADRWRLWGGNVSCTRGLFDRVGGYDPRYKGYGWEDLDFGYRLARLGIPIVIAEDANVRHHMAAVTADVRVQRACSSGAARRQFESIHGAGSSGAAEPVSSGAWNRAVGTAARLGPKQLATAAKVIDLALPVLPRAVGRKLVALTVEAGGVSGFKHGTDEPQGRP